MKNSKKITKTQKYIILKIKNIITQHRLQKNVNKNTERNKIMLRCRPAIICSEIRFVQS